MRLEAAKNELEKDRRQGETQLAGLAAALERARAEVAHAKGQADVAQVWLASTVLRAPRSGIVVYAKAGEGRPSDKVGLGMITREGQPILYLRDVSRMVVGTEINEADIGKVNPGAPVEARLAAPERVPSTPAPDARPAPAPKAAEPAPAAPVVVAPAPVPRPATTAAKPAPPAALPDVRPAPAPAAMKPPPVEIIPPPQRASTTTPTRNVSAPENGSRAPAPARAAEAIRPPAPAAPRPAEPARATAGGETTDGSAAVDWLLKTRR